MVLGRKGFLPVDGDAATRVMGTSIVRVPLVRGSEPILHNYCAFWKKDNPNPYAAEFAHLLHAQFSK